MNSRQWITVVVMGLALGTFWSTGYADWGPSWVDRLPRLLGDIVMVLPLTVMLVCAATLEWWKWPAASAYGIILVASGTVGIVRDERLFGCACCTNEPWITLVPVAFLCIVLFGGPFLAVAWGLGRFTRKVLRGKLSRERP